MACHIRAQANATRIDVYDEIGDGGMFGEGCSAKDFAAQLAGVTGPLDVHINSYGGSVKDGIAITSAIRSHNGPKRTIVDGMACSAASVIMQAGDERIVQPGAMVMIHDAFAGVVGNAAEMQRAADELEKFSDNIAKVYADRAGGTPEQWRTAMRAESWYTANEAVDAGLADKVGTGAAALPGELDLSAFASVPDRVMAQLREMPLRQPAAAYQPQPYERESWENVLCPVCGCYSDDDAKYCGQCGVMLAGRDDVASERAVGDGDGSDGAMNAAGQQVANAALEYLRRQAKQHTPAATATEPTDAASIDQSDWDGPKAMSMAAKSDDPAATYKEICAGRRDGDPATQSSWALPYRYPGKDPNAAGVRNALSRLPQTQGLTNEAAARALLERLMKQINPDHDGDGAGNSAPSWATNETAAPPAWLTQDQPAAPAWLNLAKEANQ
jgi:ATP-dependent Clp endopeptidase proteolytic subunit ClpP